jgi:O-antigen ligase
MGISGLAFSGLLPNAVSWSLVMRKLTYLATLVMIFVIPWEDSVSAVNIGSLSRLIGFAVAGLWFATIIIEGRIQKPHLFHILVLLFFIWNLMSMFWSLDTKGTLQRIITYSQLFILMLIYWDVFQNTEKLVAGLQAYILGAYVLVASTIYNFLLGKSAVAYEGRYSATGVNAVDLALILMLGLPIAMHLFFIARGDVQGILQKVINFLFVPLSIFTIILTGSRTSLIAVIPFGVFMIGTRQIKINQKVFIFITFFLASLFFFPFIPQTVIDRLGTIGDSIGEGDLGGRVNLWREGIAVLADHPVLGIGGGAIDYTIGAAVHNTFISVAAETGFIGFALFLSILGLVIYKVVGMPGRTSGLWLAVFMIWVIGVLSLSWEFRKVTWMMLSFMVIESSFEEQICEQDGGIEFSEDNRQSFELGESISG